MKEFLTISILMWALLSSGCGGYSFTEDMTEVNTLITQSNTERFQAFSTGMANCGSNAACQVGLAMGFSANLGQQPLYKPETTSDILKAVIPYAAMAVDVARLWRMGATGSDSAGGFIITGDNNQLSGISNKLTADRQSSVGGEFNIPLSISPQSYILSDESAFAPVSTTIPSPATIE